MLNSKFRAEVRFEIELSKQNQIYFKTWKNRIRGEGE